MPIMKEEATLSYSHGFNIVEEGMKIREDITVIMMAPKSPGSEVREEYKRGFGVPTLIAVHPENDPKNEGLELAKAYAVSIKGLIKHTKDILFSDKKETSLEVQLKGLSPHLLRDIGMM